VEKTTFENQPISYPEQGKFQPWVAFSRNKNIPNRFMIDADGMKPKEKPIPVPEPVPGSAGETN
jgi:hypothetical protein